MDYSTNSPVKDTETMNTPSDKTPQKQPNKDVSSPCVLFDPKPRLILLQTSHVTQVSTINLLLVNGAPCIIAQNSTSAFGDFQ